MSVARVRPGPVVGTMRAPPSKSVTHRAYLLAALSDTPAAVHHPLRGADTNATLACLVRLGASVDVAQDIVRFRPAPLLAPREALDCANSGTTLRLLTGQAARLVQPVTLDGDASLRGRPNGALLHALAALGVETRSKDGRAPITLRGPLRAGTVDLPAGTSSQFASSLLFALGLTSGSSVLRLAEPIASRPYWELSLAMARSAGLRADEDAAIHIEGRDATKVTRIDVEGDWSAAAFQLAAGIVSGGKVQATGLDPASLQGDRAIVALLQRFGCDVAFTKDGATATGRILHAAGPIDVAATPDLFPILAIVAAFAPGTTTFTGGAALRHKESDRIRAVAEGLAAIGVRSEERPDGLVVHGGTARGGTVKSLGDHRIHMAFAVAGTAVPIVVDDAACAAVSYPGFHADLAAAGAHIEVVA